MFVPPELFGRQPADALHVTAFDLAEIDGRIQRITAVVQDVGAQYPILSGQRIDNDLGNGGAVGVVVERAAAERRAVVVDLRRAVVARCRQ